MTNPSDTRDSELVARLRKEGNRGQPPMGNGCWADLADEAADTIDRLTSTGEAYGWVFQDSLDPSREPLFTRKPYVAEVWRNAHGTVTPVYASPREGHVEAPLEPTEAIIRAAMDRLGWTTKPTPPEYENFGSARISDGLSEEDAARIDGELVEEFREVYRAMLAALQSRKPE